MRPANPAPRSLKLLLLACDRLCRTLAGTRIGMRALTANRQAAAMTQAAIAAEIHQAFDVHRGLAAQIAFDVIVAVDRLADLDDFGIGKLVHPAVSTNADLVDDLLGKLLADTVNILKRDHDALVGRYVDASYTGHLHLHVGRFGQTAGRLSLPRVRWRPAL